MEGHIKAMNYVKDFAGSRCTRRKTLDVYRREGLVLT